MAPRRRTLACLGLLAAAAPLLGCGSEEPPDRSVSAEAAENITAKLELIDTRFTDEDCEGAEEALTSLREDVPNVDANAAFREDLSSLLEDLDAQIEEECAASDETTTSSSTKEDTDTSTETDTVPTETVPLEEEEPTTTDEEVPPPPDDEDEGEEEEPAPTPDPPDPPAPEPSIPPSSGGTGGGGSDPSGGVTPPAFESGRKAAG